MFAQRHAHGVGADDGAWRTGIALGASPDRPGKMAIVMPARNDVPVQMRRHVAEAGEIHLVGSEKRAHDLLDGENHIHQGNALARIEIGHLANVGGTHDPAKPGVIGIIDEHDAAGRRLPEDRPTRCSA